MSTEVIKDKLKAYVELLKVFSAFVIALGGGLGTIFFNLDSGTKALFLLIGSVVEVFFIIASARLLMEIHFLIRRLEDERL
ncbi:hypothetical protein [Hydrogenivirga sp.]